MISLRMRAHCKPSSREYLGETRAVEDKSFSWAMNHQLVRLQTNVYYADTDMRYHGFPSQSL